MCNAPSNNRARRRQYSGNGQRIPRTRACTSHSLNGRRPRRWRDAFRTTRRATALFRVKEPPNLPPTSLWMRAARCRNTGGQIKC
eukprot:5402495-Lingulodinium_polyedra.AAC.1